MRAKEFKKGDLVFKRAFALKSLTKWDVNWEGPFVVTEMLRGGAYRLAEADDQPLPRPWNIGHLKKILHVEYWENDEELAAREKVLEKKDRRRRRDKFIFYCFYLPLL